MHYASLYEYLPEIAEKETRTLILSAGSSESIPPGQYALIEYYCVDPKCDCRRVMLHIFSEQEKSNVAVVNFGWESRLFYEKWLGDTDEDWIKELKGPSLNTWSPQASYAQELLTVIQNFVLKDKEYVKRLQKHYAIFKDKIMTQKNFVGDSGTEAVISIKIGRNDPCPCGSGLKHKKCCGK